MKSTSRLWLGLLLISEFLDVLSYLWFFGLSLVFGLNFISQEMICAKRPTCDSSCH